MIGSISLFTLLLLQFAQFFTYICVIYLIAWLIAKPVKAFWGSITYKTKP